MKFNMKMLQMMIGRFSNLRGLTFLHPTSFKLFSTNVTQNYIVILREPKYKEPKLITLSQISLLSSVLGSKEDALASIVCSFNCKVSGFSANLTWFQAKKLKKLPEVSDLWVSRTFQLQSNQSWKFLKLFQNKLTSSDLLKKANQGEGIIIGIIDTGIWPESKSFSDEGYGPIPSRWKGICQEGELFDKSHCNRKIIGARWYPYNIPEGTLDKDYRSARDFIGHGTNTASIAAGNIIQIEDPDSFVRGTFHGGAPRAMISVYKIFFSSTCREQAVIRAICDAVNDGVDIVSLSINATHATVATFIAAMSGISVIAAAGNFGPAPYTVRNYSPWVTTVAAATINRIFATIITLGNKTKIMGQSLYLGSLTGFKELTTINSQLEGNSDDYKIANKIVFYKHGSGYSLSLIAQIVHTEEAAGLIVELNIDVHIESFYSNSKIPFVIVDRQMGLQILEYIQSTSVPIANVDRVFPFTGNDVIAPKIANFSSRGPNPIYLCIKPDIAAPGVTIFCSEGEFQSLVSGTSIACPHVTGIVALLKVIHPTWSPAAIKSAIMTTASTENSSGESITLGDLSKKIADPFDFGSGFINPSKAAEPGLIYDISKEEYLEYFRERTNSIDLIKSIYCLNLPSVLVLAKDIGSNLIITRTVKNVGPINAIYNALIKSPLGVIMEVLPMKLEFNASTTTHTFQIFLSASHEVSSGFSFGSLTWIDDANHTVRIPIAVIWRFKI